MSRAAELLDLLAAEPSLAIVCHDNPDPDALASAMALRRIAEEAGVGEVGILYGGTISHQQNRAFVNLFEVDPIEFDPDALADYGAVAFVDHSIPGANNAVPPETPVDIVIDHHPAEGVQARFVDRRESVGASATILAEYLEDLDLGPGEALATALLFAIRRETLGFLRGATPAEYAAAAYLQPRIDTSRLRELATPPLTGATVDAVGSAIEHRVVRGACLVSHVGRTTERDALPQAADYLLNLEGVSTVVVSGIVGDAIQLSARSTNPGIHVGEVLGGAFGDVGSAGGHDDMAGGRVPLGLFADWLGDGAASGTERLTTLVARLVAERIFDAMGLDADDPETADPPE